jgi:DNA polymerase I-like protein with 3'-5' exonuclease and polymerase domains
VSQQVDQNGYIEQFVSKRRRGIDRAPAAANSFFQGLASEGAKRAVVQLTKEMYVDQSSPLYGSRLTVFAHDESIIDIPDIGTQFVHDAATRQAAVMIEGMKSVVPDVAIKAEPALMRYWYKKAEPVFNDAGLLVPWEPK